MKKKFLLVVLSIVMALSCVAGLVACGSNVNGTYYMYMNGEKQDSITLKIDGDEVKMTTTMAGITATVDGTCKVSGKTVTLTMTMAGETESTKLTVVSDGVLKAEDGGVYFCKEGKTPPAADEE